MVNVVPNAELSGEVNRASGYLTGQSTADVHTEMHRATLARIVAVVRHCRYCCSSLLFVTVPTDETCHEYAVVKLGF